MDIKQFEKWKEQFEYVCYLVEDEVRSVDEIQFLWKYIEKICKIKARTPDLDDILFEFFTEASTLRYADIDDYFCLENTVPTSPGETDDTQELVEFKKELDAYSKRLHRSIDSQIKKLLDSSRYVPFTARPSDKRQDRSDT